MLIEILKISEIDWFEDAVDTSISLGRSLS